MAVDPGDDTQTENPQSWNKYAYVRNNPIGSRDPDGRITALAGFVIGAAVEYGSEVYSNYKSGKSGSDAWTSVSLTKIGTSGAVGALTSGLSALEGVGLAGRVAIGAAGSVAESEGHALAVGKNISGKEALTSAALGSGAELLGAAGKAIAHGTETDKGLQGVAKRLENIAAEGRPRAAQTARATAAAAQAAEYGEGKVAETVKAAAVAAVASTTEKRETTR